MLVTITEEEQKLNRKRLRFASELSGKELSCVIDSQLARQRLTAAPCVVMHPVTCSTVCQVHSCHFFQVSAPVLKRFNHIFHLFICILFNVSVSSHYLQSNDSMMKNKPKSLLKEAVMA
jgi:hypothetical protein